MKKCLVCKKELVGKQQKFCCNKHQGIFSYKKNKDKYQKYQDSWFTKVKIEKGFKKVNRQYYCLVCNYKWKNKNIWIKRKEKFDFYPTNCPNCLSKNWDFGSNIPCEVCERILISPLIHHKDGNHNNNIKENRVALCQDCHTAIHHGIGTNKKHAGRKNRRRNYGKYGKNFSRKDNNETFLIRRKLENFIHYLNKGEFRE